MDLVLVLDLSTTTNSIYSGYKDLAIRLIQRLYISPRHTRVALIGFSSVSKTRVIFNLKAYKDKERTIAAIQRVQSSGGTTAIGEGIRKALTQLDEREGARPKLATRVMVVFTDGWTNKGPDPGEMSQQAVKAGFQVFSVGISGEADGLSANQYTLESIAQDQRHQFMDRNFEQLIGIVRERNARCL